MSIERGRSPSLCLRCPACRGKARVRNSRENSPSTRSLYMECMDPKCRCIFEAIAETTKVFAPSMLPESDQHPQMLTLRKGKRAAAMDQASATPPTSGTEEPAQGACTG